MKQRCKRCEGCGKFANAAVLMGLERPIPCPDCEGTGEKEGAIMELYCGRHSSDLVPGPDGKGFCIECRAEGDPEPEIRCSMTDEEREEIEEISRISRETAEKYHKACVLKRECHLEWCFDCCWRD